MVRTAHTHVDEHPDLADFNALRNLALNDGVETVFYPETVELTEEEANDEGASVTVKVILEDGDGNKLCLDGGVDVDFDIDNTNNDGDDAELEWTEDELTGGTARTVVNLPGENYSDGDEIEVSQDGDVTTPVQNVSAGNETTITITS